MELRGADDASAPVCHIDRSVLNQLTDHAISDLPAECCGIVLGQRRGGCYVVTRTIASPNVSRADLETSYEIDPELLCRHLTASAGDHPRVIGFYHCHPDGPAVPSTRDRQNAWRDMVYLIIEPQPGGRADVAAWLFGPTVQVPLRIDSIDAGGADH